MQTSGLDLAISLHRDGQLDQALEQYLAILENEPDNADANRLCGLVLLNRARKGDRDRMIAYLQKAVRLRPEVPEFQNDLGK